MTILYMSPFFMASDIITFQIKSEYLASLECGKKGAKNH